jgi:serine protease Do
MRYETQERRKRHLWLKRFFVALLCLAAVAIAFTAYRDHRTYQWAGTAAAAAPGIDPAEIELLQKQNEAFEMIVRHTIPSVVYISTEGIVKVEDSPYLMDPFFRQFFGDLFPQMPREEREHALGSGVIFDPSGYVVTNNHVIEHASDIKVLLSDKRVFKAKLIGGDADVDIAVLKIHGANLPSMALGDSSTLHVGDTVLAFGNPFGLSFTVTRGTVSALGRAQFSIEPVQDFIQTDAPINPGNSGGPLVDVKGEMVGINTAILSGNAGPGGEGGFIGIGFSIPIDMAKHTIEDLIKYGHVTRAYLGATISPVTEELAQEFKIPDIAGAFVQDVAPGGPAAKAGLKPGDVIREFNGSPASDSGALLAMVADSNPGSTVTLGILRNGKPLTLKVTLERRPARLNYPGTESQAPAEGPLAGVTVQNLTPTLREQLGVPASAHGVVITQVDPNTPAADYLSPGDVIVSVNRQPVDSADEFNNLAQHAVGETLLRVIHHGQAAFVVIPPQGSDDQ